MQSWKTTPLCGGFKPRQFEYHPTDESLMLFGTLEGEVSITNHITNTVIATSRSFAVDHDAILGLCWYREDNTRRFFAASGAGTIKLCQFDTSSGEIEDLHCYPNFSELTSVHVNSSNQLMLCSGYSSDVHVNDVETGSLVRKYSKIHDKHINITRFSNLTPSLFASSSFDKTAKVWDTRMGSDQPIYQCRSDNGIVMVCFSPDDLFLMTSAVDNEIRQYTAIDGRQNLVLDLPKTGRMDNYTRAYYMNGGDVILTGASEENVVRMFCAYTGDMLHSSEMYPGRLHPSLYVQSLRGSPHEDFSFSTLVNYRDSTYSLEIIKVDCKVDQWDNPINIYAQRTSTCNWMGDLDVALKEDISTCDVTLIAEGYPDSPFPAHAALLSARSPYLCAALSSPSSLLSVPGTTPAMIHAGIGFLYRDELVLPEVSEPFGGSTSATVTPALPGWPFLYDHSARLTMPDDPYNTARKDSSSTSALSSPTRVRSELYASARQKAKPSPVLSSSPPSVDPPPVSLRESGLSGLMGSDYISCGPVNIDKLLCVVDAAMQIAALWGLPRMMTLLEARVGRMLEVSTATQIANLAYRRNAAQLLNQSIHFLASHLVCVQSTAALADVEPAVAELVLALHEQSLAPQYRGFPDLALPRSALPSSSLSSSSSSAGASQTEAALPTWHKQVPYMSGHGALIGDGGHMFVLGGVNRHQYTSLRFPLAYDPDTAVWSKLKSTGAAPNIKVHHSYAGLGSPSPRHILLFGGGDTKDSDNSLHLLDTRYMVWQQVKPFGPLPHARTNHTLTLVSPAAVTASVTTCEPEDGGFDSVDSKPDGFEVPSDPEEEGKAAPEPEPPVGGIRTAISQSIRRVFRELRAPSSSSPTPGPASLSSPTSSPSRPSPSQPDGPWTPKLAAVPAPETPVKSANRGPSSAAGTDSPVTPSRRSLFTPKRSLMSPTVAKVDPGATVSLLLFGGFCGRTNECFNDVHILSVRRVSDGLAPSAAAAAGGAGAFQAPLGTYGSPLRRVDTAALPVETPVADEASGPTVVTSAPVAGDFALSRLPDTVDLDADGTRYYFTWMRPNVGGARPQHRLAHTTCFMELPEGEGGNRAVVFGGAGFHNVFNDVHVLRVSNTAGMVWEVPIVEGTAPDARYCHSASTIGYGCVSRSMVMYGGMTIDRSYLTDVHVATLTGARSGGPPVLRWSSPTLITPSPPPRCKATFVYTPEGILCFGGEVKFGGRDDGSRDYLEDARMFRLTLSPALTEAKWTNLHVSACNPGPDPQVLVQPTSAHADLLRLVDAPEFADVTFNMDSSGGYAFPVMSPLIPPPSDDPAALHAHSWLLTSRSSRFHALLSSGMVEATSKKVPVVGIPKVVFKLLIDFLYTDTMDPRIDPELAHDVMCGAAVYSLPRLARLAEGRLIRFVDEDNALSMVAFADVYSMELLSIAARSVILRNFTMLELQWREEHHAYQGRGDELVPPDIVAKAKRAEASPRHQLGAPTVDDDFDNDEDDDSDDDDEGAGGGATGLRKSGRED